MILVDPGAKCSHRSGAKLPGPITIKDPNDIAAASTVLSISRLVLLRSSPYA